jgi:hypothetical protein
MTLMTAMTMKYKGSLKAVRPSIRIGEVVYWAGSIVSVSATKPVAVAVWFAL